MEIQPLSFHQTPLTIHIVNHGPLHYPPLHTVVHSVCYQYVHSVPAVLFYSKVAIRGNKIMTHEMFCFPLDTLCQRERVCVCVCLIKQRVRVCVLGIILL
ncbi:hypothetical protein UPYG_G00349050 [Umbra pygmaea]|uniref:Uncharacterized protein n=1 Tax=Umbra pygmaea TaxID=75934 RepID=A0ABD0VY16_UMBPY